MRKQALRRILSIIMVAVMTMSLTVAAENTAKHEDMADLLNEAGFFNGTDQGYELDRALTRVEGAVMLVRMLGQEETALEDDLGHPFSDVPEWANPYVGYLYTYDMTNGISENQFGSTEQMTVDQYMTFVLRALGYDDSQGDFVWNESLEKAEGLGIISVNDVVELLTEEFKRDQAVLLTYRGLRASYKGFHKPLIELMVGQGFVTEWVKNLDIIIDDGTGLITEWSYEFGESYDDGSVMEGSYSVSKVMFDELSISTPEALVDYADEVIAAEEAERMLEEEGSKIVALGLMAPLSGDLAIYGEAVLNGANLAVTKLNEDGGIDGRQVTLTEKDTEANAVTALRVFGELVEDDGVDAVIGPVISGTSLLVGEEAGVTEVPVLTPTATHPEVTLQSNYMFRATYTDDEQGKVMAKFATDNLGAETAVVLMNENSDYSGYLTDGFTSGFSGEILALNSYGYDMEPDTLDVIVETVKQLDPDVVYIPDYFNTAAIVTEALKDRGVEAVLLGSDGWDIMDVHDYEGLNDGYYTNYWNIDEPSEQVEVFVADYENAFGEQPGVLSALAYDAVNLMAGAVDRANDLEGSLIRENLESTEYTGVTGTYVFDSNGIPHKKDMAIIKYEDGRPVFVTRVKSD